MKVKTKMSLLIIAACVVAVIACKKENKSNGEFIKVEKNTTGVLFTDIDFEKIGHQDGMLKFESWEHYISVIEALQDVCVAYTQERINNLIAENGGVEDEDYISEKLESESFSQFAPIHDFCAMLQFNSLYQVLEPLDMEWRNNPDASEEENPFIVKNMGRYQSALHNADGFVRIAENVYDTDYFQESSNSSASQKAVASNCRNQSTRSSSPSRSDSKYKYVLHAHCWTSQSFTRSFNNTWKIKRKNGKRSDWWPSHEIIISGEKYSDCDGVNAMNIYSRRTNMWIGYYEVWHVQTRLPAHLHPYNTYKFTSRHYAGGLSATLYM
jgi:hypothetical protein